MIAHPKKAVRSLARAVFFCVPVLEKEKRRNGIAQAVKLAQKRWVRMAHFN